MITYRSMKSCCLLAIMLLVGIGTAETNNNDTGRFENYPYKIVYETYRENNWELYMVNVDGLHPINLTRTPDVDELYPHASPDGTKICFVADEGEKESKIRARDAISFRCVRRVSQSISTRARAKGNRSSKSGLRLAPHFSVGKLLSRRQTGFIYHDIFLQHKTGTDHPESPQRLTVIVTRLREKGLFAQLVTLTPSPPSSEWLTTIHTSQYVERVRRSCQEGVKYLDSMDTPISPKSYEVAVTAVAGVLLAIDGVMEGKFRNAFCAIRPPGHHALKERAMGFCLFNNVAIGVRYIQKKYKLSKVLIADWDVHHGNGTQAAFYDDPTVLYFSIHQYPFYPGSGSEKEKGTGKGFGYNINVPLKAGCGDKEYKKAFELRLRPKAMEFNPDFVLISAGFDAYKDDPLGGMNVTTKGFAELTKIVKEIAEKCCDGRLVSLLEGGYNLDGLANSVEAHISVLQK